MVDSRSHWWGSKIENGVFNMKAAKFLGDSTIKIINKELPELDDNEVLIKVKSCGLCGSDKRLFYEGANQVPGHEIAGVVDKTNNESKLKVGERVIIYIPIFCGECKYCRTGDNNRCQNVKELVGWQRDGGYAEYVKVPEGNVIPIPDSLSYEDGVLLLDTVGTAAHAIRLALSCSSEKIKGSKVLIIGCGPLGLGTVLVLKAFGFQNIYASDLSEKRLNLANKFGAIPYQLHTDDINGEFELVLEASGSAAGRKGGIYAVEPGGKFVVLGESNDPFIINPTPALRRKDFFTIRSFYFPLNEVEDNFKLYKEYHSLFQQLIGEKVNFNEIENTFTKFCNGKTIKPFIKFY